MELDFSTIASTIANFASKYSSDPDTKTGCAILTKDSNVILGTNRLAPGVVSDPKRLVRPEKYLWIPHAEQSAIAGAARLGISLEGASIYVTFLPCMACGSSIIISGIKHVRVYRKSHEINFTQKDKWQADFDHIQGLLSEAGISFGWC